MYDVNDLPSLPVYEWDRAKKRAFLDAELSDLTDWHAARCPQYARMRDAWPACGEGLEALPFLPVRLFKELTLKSVPDEALHRTMTSSGTTGQQVSRIYLDRETSALQSKVLSRIMGEFLGKQRLPMIILDTSAVIRNRAMFSARGAGILGFSMFARDKVFALDEHMELDTEGLEAFLKKHEGEDIFLFGFTFMIWKHVVRALEERGERLDIPNGILVHGGGWKKLAGEAVSPGEFKARVAAATGVERVSNYYGMAEQTGCIYMECPQGHLHASLWSDIVVRRGRDYRPCEPGEEGVLQVLSPLPRSYPGHSLLTEDLGVLLGEDDCPCGRKGKYFKVTGRVPRAEVRGCSDTYEG